MKNINFEQLLNETITQNQKTITETLKKQIVERVIDQLSRTMESELKKITEKFFQEHLVNDIETMLIDNKTQILENLKDGFIKIGAQLSTVMYQKALENLAIGSYKAKDILKMLFN